MRRIGVIDQTLNVSGRGSVAQWSEHPPRKWKVPGSNPGRANNFPLNGGNCSHGSKNHLDDGIKFLTADSHLEDFALSAVEKWHVHSMQPRLSNLIPFNLHSK